MIWGYHYFRKHSYGGHEIRKPWFFFSERSILRSLNSPHFSASRALGVLKTPPPRRDRDEKAAGKNTTQTSQVCFRRDSHSFQSVQILWKWPLEQTFVMWTPKDHFLLSRLLINRHWMTRVDVIGCGFSKIFVLDCCYPLEIQHG